MQLRAGHKTSVAFMRALVIVCFGILWLASVHAVAQTPPPKHLQTAIARIEAMVAAEHAKDDVGSVTVGVVSGDKLVWTRSFGFADMEAKIPATSDTVYRIGSLTKRFTGLMLLQLIQDGKVSIEDPVERYFPEVNKIQNRFADAAPITLGQLATMTAGLAREPGNAARYVRGPVADWENVLIAALAETKYAYAPNNRYFYSNIGYATLGAALSRAAGMPYVEFVQKRILTPLEMTHTVFEPNMTILPHIAKGYELGAFGAASFEASQQGHEGRGYRVPNGALYSTVGDLARFVSFELGEGSSTVLKKEVLEDTFDRLISANRGKTTAYGIGIQMRQRDNVLSFGHGGLVSGYTAHAQFHRTSKTGVIILRNVHGGRFDLSDLTFRALNELVKN